MVIFDAITFINLTIYKKSKVGFILKYIYKDNLI